MMGKYVNGLGLEMYRKKSQKTTYNNSKWQGNICGHECKEPMNVYYGIYCAKNNYICYETVKMDRISHRYICVYIDTQKYHPYICNHVETYCSSRKMGRPENMISESLLVLTDLPT